MTNATQSTAHQHTTDNEATALAAPDHFGCELGQRSPQERAAAAFQRRVEAAHFAHDRPIPDHPCNGDEARYHDQNFFASFTKGLPHDPHTGEVDAAAYRALVRALHTEDPGDFEAIPLGCPSAKFATPLVLLEFDARFAPANRGLSVSDGGPVQRRLVNPQAALAFDLEGADSHHLSIAPAPQFDSAAEAGEMIELYWMALARDVPFAQYGHEPITQAAIADLNRFITHHPGQFAGPVDRQGRVTAQTLFRGESRTPDGRYSDVDGPYLSQFLLLDIPFGALTIDPRIITVLPATAGGKDYLIDFDTWLHVQQECTPDEPDAIDPSGKTFLRNGRDLGRYVHIDVLFQAYFNALLILLQRPSASNGNAGIAAPFTPGNPYLTSSTQTGLGTFGGPHAATLMSGVATRALKAVWYQKWSVHRRLRPEEFGGRLEARRLKRVAPERYPVHAALLDAAALATIEKRYGTHLLPQAFPEGSPLHPAYGAGHATVAGACVTMLKAWFAEDFPIPHPVQLDATGQRVPYTGGATLTVGGELNKLAANIALGRNHAGVHWRSDASIRLGEQMAISILQDQLCTYSEEEYRFTFTPFAGGEPVVIATGDRPCLA